MIVGRREILIVAKLEASEIFRDPQVGYVLAATVALVHVLLLAGGGLYPRGGHLILVGMGPLAILFLAGPRRGRAHEAAFARIVSTCPIAPSDWFWGRALGLHAITGAYAALVAPAFILETSVASQPLETAANGIVGLLAMSTLLIFAGLGLARSERGPAIVALAAVTILLCFRLVFGVRAATQGAPMRVAAFALALVPSVPIGMAADLTLPGYVPWWALALSVACTLLAAAGWSARVHGLRPVPALALVGVWALGAIAIALTLDLEVTGSALPEVKDDERAARLFDLLPPLALLSIVPAAIAFARSRRTGRSRA